MGTALAPFSGQMYAKMAVPFSRPLCKFSLCSRFQELKMKKKNGKACSKWETKESSPVPLEIVANTKQKKTCPKIYAEPLEFIQRIGANKQKTLLSGGPVQIFAARRLQNLAQEFNYYSILRCLTIDSFSHMYPGRVSGCVSVHSDSSLCCKDRECIQPRFSNLPSLGNSCLSEVDFKVASF